MLGRTADGLFWMFRYLERSENTARLIETGFRIGLTRRTGENEEWQSVLQTAAVDDLYYRHYTQLEASKVIDFLLRDANNPSSVMSSIATARRNARRVRTAITGEVWGAINDTFLYLKQALKRPVSTRDLPVLLSTIRQQSQLVRGATHGSMLRNDLFDFCRLGTFLERADNTARILDVKYYVLLPSISQIGSNLDNIQWETILRSVGGQRAYRTVDRGDPCPKGIANFLIFDGRMPRSLMFSTSKIATNMHFLEKVYGIRLTSHDHADQLIARLENGNIERVFEEGLHEFISDFLRDTARLGTQIESDYRFRE
ncbi:MAG: alpha-E domain-containing protein [Rhodobacteraceae bacterium]|nr:alpha-E domain-containing protein [Paracoccaceae bacterium]MCY4197676.1 alpha-E domain-containing protein [Paracoccaceae bacterium]